MSNQKYSGEVNLDHPVIDKRPDGTYLYFHPLPPSPPKLQIIFPPDDDPDPDDDQTTD